LEETPAADSAAVVWLRRNMNWLVLVGALVLIALPRVMPAGPVDDYLSSFQRLSEWTLRKLEHLFKDYGYYVVFFGILAENSMFLGFLIPGSIILILAGLSAENGSINLWLVLGAAVAGALIGDTLSYATGRFGWRKSFERGGMGKMIERVRTKMDSNRTWIILGYHFAGYSRAVGPLASGLFKIPYRKWAPLDYAGATAWVIVYALIGVVLGLFGLEFGDTKKMARFLELFFTAVIVGAIGFAVLRSIRASKTTDRDGVEDGEPSPAIVSASED
jgi:membrane protein DedA with SNARE-associated domain